MSNHVVSVIEDKTRDKPSRLNRVFRISLKQLLVLILVVAVVFASFAWASDRIEIHKRWASMIEMSQRFRVHFTEVYLRLYSLTENETMDPLSHEIFSNEISYASWTMNQLVSLDSAHASELFRIEDLIMTLQESGTSGLQLQLRDSQFQNLSDTLHAIAENLPLAYWNPLNTTSINSETGPPFWYFGPSPPDEALLQQIATLAIQAKAIIGP